MNSGELVTIQRLLKCLRVLQLHNNNALPVLTINHHDKIFFAVYLPPQVQKNTACQLQLPMQRRRLSHQAMDHQRQLWRRPSVSTWHQKFDPEISSRTITNGKMHATASQCRRQPNKILTSSSSKPRSRDECAAARGSETSRRDLNNSANNSRF